MDNSPYQLSVCHTLLPPPLSPSLLHQVHCSLSQLVARQPEGHLFKQLLDRLKFYSGFEINDQIGSALTDHEMTDIHYNKITALQVSV